MWQRARQIASIADPEMVGTLIWVKAEPPTKPPLFEQDLYGRLCARGELEYETNITDNGQPVFVETKYFELLPIFEQEVDLVKLGDFLQEHNGLRD